MNGAERAGGAGRVVRDPVAVAYLLAVLLGLVQAGMLGEPGRTLRATVPYAAALLVVVAVRVVGPRSEAMMRRWLGGLIIAGTLLAVWLLRGFLVALLDWPTRGFYTVKVQVTSPLGDHNTAAGLLLPVIVAAAAATARDRRWAAALAVTVLGLAATLSRGAVAVLLGVTALAFVLSADRRFKGALLAAALASLGLLSALFVVLTDPTAPPPTDDGPVVGASMLARVDLAERGLELGLAHPALGVGLGGFEEQAGDLPPPNDHAHQLLAHAVAEGGLVLLAVAVAVPVALLVRAWRARPGADALVLLLGGLALVGHAQLEILGGRLGYEVLLALLTTLAAASVARTRRPSSGSPVG